jgi:glycosyltransferase involved in cell wall biosynthesis
MTEERVGSFGGRGSETKQRCLTVNLSSRGVGRYGASVAASLPQCSEFSFEHIVTCELAEAVPNVVNDLPQERTTFVRMSRTHRVFTALKIVRRVLIRPPAIVHDLACMSHGLGPLFWPITALRTRLVVTLHDVIPHSGLRLSSWWRFKRSCMFRFAHHFIVHGETSKTQLTELGIDPSRISIATLGEHGFYASVPQRVSPIAKVKRPGDVWVLFFGSLRPNKGVDLICRIADLVTPAAPYVSFIVAGSPNVGRELGSGPWPARLQELLAEMSGRSDFTVIPRFIADREVADLFQCCDVVLLPYQDASQSAVLMQAIGLGLPAVMTGVGDLPEAVQGSSAAVICENTVDALAAGVLSLATDPDALQRATADARWLAETRHSRAQLGADTVAAYAASLRKPS